MQGSTDSLIRNLRVLYIDRRNMSLELYVLPDKVRGPHGNGLLIRTWQVEATAGLAIATIRPVRNLADLPH